MREGVARGRGVPYALDRRPLTPGARCPYHGGNIIAGALREAEGMGCCEVVPWPMHAAGASDTVATFYRYGPTADRITGR